MKINELKKIVEENEYKFQKTEDFIHISYFGCKMMTLDLRDQSITVDNDVKLGTPVDNNVRLTTPRIKKIMVALIEYSLTPSSEREDEKKYRIMIDNTISEDPDYLTLIINKKTYYFSAYETDTEEYQKIFTQSEIDNFPERIKCVIECGFLRKVEVL